jgi:phenylacetate-coenzyme A ligase PaaK-like adenylate-forming protein
MYGSEEMNGIAHESPDHHMKILEDNVFVEVKSRIGISKYGEGEAIITNLNNAAMPLIRYNQGDIIKTDDLDCHPCDSRVIYNILGRKLQEVIFKDVSVNAFAFSEVISTVNNQLDDVIINYQFIYSQASGRLLCKLTLDTARNEWFSSVQAALIDVFKSKFNIHINNCDIIQLTNIEMDGLKQKTIIIEE